MLHRYLALSVVLMALTACVSGDDRAAVEAANRTCLTRFPDRGPQFESCVSELETTIHDARTPRPVEHHPAPTPAHH